MSSITKPVILDETGQDIISAINTLRDSIKPTGTLTITDNGTYDVTTKATAVVKVGDPWDPGDVPSINFKLPTLEITVEEVE